MSRSLSFARIAPRARAFAARSALLLVTIVTPAALTAQAAPHDTATTASTPTASRDTTRHESRAPHYWRSMAAGFAASLLAHEGAHVVTAFAVGGHPSFGFNKGRPTVYSGINVRTDPGKQFLFSSMGLNVQAALDEGILDTPHASRGAPFERGVLAGGIATALFYITIGRTASVSDVDFMARTSSLDKTDISLIYGGVALMHLLRIHHDARYASFFVRPASPGEHGLRVGVDVQ